MANAKPALDSAVLPVAWDAIAPEGSQVRNLVSGTQGRMAHFELGAGEVSVPQRHRTVEEVWYILDGWGEMWRRRDDEEVIIALRRGTSVVIPVATSFQFRNTGRVPLAAVGVTMPPWPGDREATTVVRTKPPVVRAK